jgi:hypothetical protein
MATFSHNEGVSCPVLPKPRLEINGKIALFLRYSDAIAYLESERYAMHIWLAMALITLLAALCALFFVAL